MKARPTAEEIDRLIFEDRAARDAATEKSLRLSFEAARFVVERIEAGEHAFGRDDLDALSRAVYDLNNVRTALASSRSSEPFGAGVDLAELFALADRGWRLALRISRERLATRAAEGDE